MSKNVVHNSPWGPSQKNPKLAKDKAFYGVWYQICLKTKSNKTSTLSNTVIPTTPAASWRQFQRFPMPTIRPAGRMQLCKSLAPIHVWQSMFSTPLPYSPRFQNELSLPRSFGTAENSPCYSVVWPFPSTKQLLKSWAPTSQAAEWGCRAWQAKFSPQWALHHDTKYLFFFCHK